jgi:riboflavin synthase
MSGSTFVFTGIVESTGVVRAIKDRDGSRMLEIHTDLAAELARGASIAVNGVCLTATSDHDEVLSLDAVPETLRRTNLGELAPGNVVNLERPLRADGRLDGHIVQGHVDTVGVVESVMSEGDGRRLKVSVEKAHHRYVVGKGSIALDGVSLTVAALTADGFEVALIPHTLAVTTLGLRTRGDKVNLEFDVLAKYLERLLSP